MNMKSYSLVAGLALLSSSILVPVEASAAAAKRKPVAAASVRKPYADCAGCPEMMPVPAGSFLMGASLEEEIRHDLPVPSRGHSLPLHTVTFAKGFSMGRYPVTIAQFRKFVEETGYNVGESCFNQRYFDGHFIYENARGYNFRSPGYPVADNYPAVCVSGDDAEAYAAWLSKKTGHKYAVPNEAQYEYSLRAGTTTSFFWGKDVRDAQACEYSNQPDLDQAEALKAPTGPFYRFQCHDGYAWTSPVGHYKPNPWGLYDMQGNIWEWVSDCHNQDYKGAPTDGSTWTTGDCDARPSRGGSFGNSATSAFAGIRAPRDSSFRGHSWGFRVVRTD